MFNCLSAVSFNNSTCYYPNNSYLFQHVLKFRVPNPKTILLYTLILRYHTTTLIIIQIIHIYFNTCSKFEYRTLKPYSYILYIFYVIIQEHLLLFKLSIQHVLKIQVPNPKTLLDLIYYSTSLSYKP